MVPDLLALIPFVIACGAAASSGMAFPPGPWYRRLDRPPWTPPDWAFGVVWTVLYCLIAWAGWRVGLRAEAGAATLPLGLWACQLVLNSIWSPVFFGLRRPDAAVPIVLLLWIAVAAMVVSFLWVDTLAGIAMLPYLVWVTIASALNISVWRRNPGAHLIEAT
jgi:tryptophan-rich sensory protein